MDTFIENVFLSNKEGIKSILYSKQAFHHDKNDEFLKMYYPIVISFCEMINEDEKNNSNICQKVIKDPKEMISYIQKLLITMIMDKFTVVDQNEEAMKRMINVRLVGFPSPAFIRTKIPRCEENLGQLISFLGTVTMVAKKKFSEYLKYFVCNKCKQDFPIEYKSTEYYNPRQPEKCVSFPQCNGLIFGVSAKPSLSREYQEVKVRENCQNKTACGFPPVIWVVLENDLVDSCEPGADVLISGIVSLRWRRSGARMDRELFLEANHVTKIAPLQEARFFSDEFEEFWTLHKSNPLVGRDKILSFFCPQTYGMYTAKLAVLLALIGGCEHKSDDNRVRGEVHLLLVGDPGTAKSQFLRSAYTIVRRSVYTTGLGSTTAGLTAAAVQEDGSWMLEPGAMVLASEGLCCIDEFSSIGAPDRKSIHEAMEQQRIRVAKAGILSTLRTTCTVIAATNPLGQQYDPTVSLSVNTTLSSPLLSRFDIVLVLIDESDRHRDSAICDRILHLHQSSTTERSEEPNITWPASKLGAYIESCKLIHPIMTDAASLVISTYFTAQRWKGLEHDDDDGAGEGNARATNRLLQSLIRIAQAHARLMYRSEILLEDAVVAVHMVDLSNRYEHGSNEVTREEMVIDTEFPDNPQRFFNEKATSILRSLHLEHLLIDDHDGVVVDPPPPAGPGTFVGGGNKDGGKNGVVQDGGMQRRIDTPTGGGDGSTAGSGGLVGSCSWNTNVLLPEDYELDFEL